MQRELAKTYDPQGIEDRIYKKRKSISTRKWITPEHPLPS